MREGRLTEMQRRLLGAGKFRFDGWTHADDVLQAQALITAGYVTARDVGGAGYTCIECIVTDAGREAIGGDEIRLGRRQDDAPRHLML